MILYRLLKQLIVKVRWESSTHWVLLFMKRQESELLSVWLFQTAKAICDLLYFMRGSIGSYWSCLRLSFSLLFLLSLSLSWHFVLLRGSVRIGWSRTETAVGRISTDFASSCVGTDQGWTNRLRQRLQELENSAFMVYESANFISCRQDESKSIMTHIWWERWDLTKNCQNVQGWQNIVNGKRAPGEECFGLTRS